MEQVMIVSTGENYGDDKYIFDKESDALDFFKLVGKAIRINQDYISTIGYVSYKGTDKKSPSLSYGSLYSEEEMKSMKDKEERDRLFALAEKEAKEALERSAEDALQSV